MTYQPFLPEAAAGSIEPRHVVVPLRRVLRKCQVLTGRVTSISHADREVTVELADGHVTALGFDVLVVAPGSVARTLPIPGLAEHGIAFKTIGEAIFLRNHVLSRLDAADTTIDPTLRRRLLTFMVVGGGYAGVEALAELADMARYASKYYPTISREDIRWILVEAVRADHARGQRDDGPLHRRAAAGRRHRGQPRHPGEVDGRRPRRARRRPGVRRRHHHLDGRGQAEPDARQDRPARATAAAASSAAPTCRCEGMPGVFCAGDCAAVPDLSKDDPEARTSPSAQHAVRQAKVLGDNVIAHLRRRPLTEYKHSYAGSVASLGLYKGVAEIYGVKLRGIVAWFMHRTYHVSRMPTWNRRDPDRVRLDGRAGPRPRGRVAGADQRAEGRVRAGRGAGAEGQRGRRLNRRVVGWRRRPRSPIGRGKPLKRVRVWVRVPPGAPR